MGELLKTYDLGTPCSVRSKIRGLRRELRALIEAGDDLTGDYATLIKRVVDARDAWDAWN